MSKERFESVSYVFKTKEDPKTGDKIDLSFGPADFKRVEGDQAAQALIKLAAFQRLEKEKDTQQVQTSLKYQVLCDQTAIVGVLKQTDKATGELQTSTIKFTKSTFEPEQPEDDREDEIRRNRAMLQA